MLDGAVVAAVGLLAGASIASAVGLGLSMTGLQAAIGALNDVVDAPHDAGRKPAKPIPAGLVSVGQARTAAVAAAVGGVVLAGVIAAPGASIAMIGLALIVVAIGASYDLNAKGTTWSWLPFAVGIPILPIYGWLGAVGLVADWFVPLYAIGVLAGAALAVANARADLERDRAAGIGSIAVRLGSRGAWWAHVLLYAVAVVLAVGYLAGIGAGGSAFAIVGLPALGLAGAVGLAWDGSPARRERAWQIEAICVALFAVAWLGIVVS